MYRAGQWVQLYADADLRPLLPYFYALYADEASLFFGDDDLVPRRGKIGHQIDGSIGTTTEIRSISRCADEQLGLSGIIAVGKNGDGRTELFTTD